MKYLLSVVGTLAVLIIATQAVAISKEQAEQLMREDQAKEQDDLATVQQVMSDEQAAGNGLPKEENVANLEAEMQQMPKVEKEGAPMTSELNELQIQDSDTATTQSYYRYYRHYYVLYCRWRGYYYRLLKYYKTYRHLYIVYRNLYYHCIRRRRG